MNSDLNTTVPRHPLRLLRFLVPAIVALPLGYGVGALIAKFGPDLGPINAAIDGVRWADAVGVVLAATLAVAAIVTLVVSFNPRRSARLLGLDGDAGADDTAALRRQGLVCVLSAFIMVLPMMLPALGMGALPAMGLVAVLLVGHTLLNIDLWRRSDELIRAVTVESGAVVFWLGQGLLFLWAAGERLGIAPTLSAWDVYVVLMGLYLVTAAVVTARRGLA